MNVALGRTQRGTLAAFVVVMLLVYGVGAVHIIGTAWESALPTSLDPLFIFVFTHPILAGLALSVLVVSWFLATGYALMWLLDVVTEWEPEVSYSRFANV